MKYNLIIFVFMLLNTACTDGEKPEITDNNEEQDSYVHQSKDTMDVLGKELQKELTSFILYEDSLYRKEENYGTWDIYIVNFFTKDDDCFVRFFSSLYYSVKDFSGYVIIENKMVAFYNTEIKCNCGLVNTSLLQHSMTDDYPNDSRGTLTPFEPKGKTFKIHNKDSLELVYSGYF